MKVAALWTKLSGYLNCALLELRARGAEVLVVNEQAGPDAPFDETDFMWIERRYQWRGQPDGASVLRALDEFQPDVILAGWSTRVYQQVCGRYRGRALRVGCGDNQWRGTVRQMVGSMVAFVHLRRFYDAMFVPGERQVVWARKMGYPEDRILKGLFSCDVNAFAKAYANRSAGARAFLYAGRLSPEKGVAILLRAYARYRDLCGEPWPLIVAGDGPIRDEVVRAQGVDWRGFVQPKGMTAVFGAASCFVMPSTFEQWCIALHEAATAGLPIICTSACGASVHLVQDGYNGRLVTPGAVDELARAMLDLSSLEQGRFAAMGRRSAELARQFSPERFATCLLERGAALRTRLCQASERHA